MEEESQNFGHQHPLLLLLNGDQQIRNRSRVANCSRCGEKVSAPNFSCVEYCGFYLHKICAEAPREINHPFHRHHPLVLLPNPPYSEFERCICDFCDKTCEKFIYHCSCNLDFHIRCALFTYNIGKKNLKELEHFSHEDPLISTENDGEKLEDLVKCFGCWEPLANYTYFSLNCGFNLHKKCAELPFKINHMCHRKHPLILQFNNEGLFCKICQEKTQRAGFVYCCSPCEFIVHIECVSPSPLVIEDKSHQHPFTLFPRQVPFICDACGIKGNYVAYICFTCKIMVHKKCISLPRIIKSKWHDHRIFHTYFLQQDFRCSDCIICHNEVNPEHVCYCCSYCNIVFHVNCVTEDKDSYFIVSLENEDEKSSENLELLPDISIESTCVFERNSVGEAIHVKHFKHIHNLMLSDKIADYDKSCDGCMLPISDSFYYCLHCDFFLHKACAELPKMKHVWHHNCRQPLILTSGSTFRCEICDYLSNAFAYKCSECERQTCLRCVIALTPGAKKCPKHEHPLRYYKRYEGQCSACGDDDIEGAFRCKDCNFALDYVCFSLPITARHKFDEHLLKLTDHDDNSYSESHYFDICEERRDPNHWFYHCGTCDNSAHVNCVLGQYPFIKLGSIYETMHHPHPLTFVKKIYYYPDCVKCGAPCEDLALECVTSGCNFIVHWQCVEPFHLWRDWF